MKKSGWSNKTKSLRKVGKVMHEFKEGELHIGKSDKVVKNPKQAIAIALSEAGMSKKITGGGVREISTNELDKVREKVDNFLNPLGYSARVEKSTGDVLYIIEPSTRKVGNKRSDYFDGMQILAFQDGTFEVSEYQAGENENELYIYKETNSLTNALKDLIKGNKRKPIKKYAKGGGIKKRSLMSMANLVDWKGEGIKKWYMRSYPTDELGEELNDDVTFKDLMDALNNKQDVYELMGVADSVVRERLFEYLSLVYDVDYDVIYKKWLDSDDYAKGGGVDNYKLKDVVDFNYGRADEKKVLSGTITDILTDGYTISTGFRQIMVEPKDIIGYTKQEEPKKKRFGIFKDGGEVEDNFKFNYMMLDRLQSDNDYFLGYGNRSERALWAGNVDDQISEMKKLWNQLPKDKKPEWLSMEDILNYEKEMKKQYSTGGGVGEIEYKIGDIFEGNPNANYEESWQLFKPLKSYVINNKTNKIVSIHKTPYEAIEKRNSLDSNFKVHYELKPKEYYNKMKTGGGVEESENNFQQINGNNYFTYNFENKGNIWTVLIAWGKYNHVNVTKKTNNPFGNKLGNEFDTIGEAVDNYKDVNIKSNILFAANIAKEYGYEPKYSNGGSIEMEEIDINELDMPVIRSQFEEEEFEFGNGGGIYSRTMKTPDGNIMGKVQYNDFWKTYQVIIDGVVHEEFKTKEEAIQNLKNAGFGKMQLGGGIPNNYFGKTAEEVWNEWTETQRLHFLIDHRLTDLHSSKIMISFSELPESIKRAVKSHRTEGQYAGGGEVDINDWDMPVIRTQFEDEEYEFEKGGEITAEERKQSLKNNLKLKF